MNDLGLLRPSLVFVDVVELGSFRAAADRLGLSPAYVSQMISDLETRLGRQLLFRSTRKMALTPAGAAYLTHARLLHQAFHDGMAAVRNTTRGLSGHLRISAPTVFANPFFARIVDAFSNDHPDVALDITLDDALADPVGTRIDLAIRIGEAGNDPRLARKLFETRGVICTGPDTPDIGSPGDLERLRWLRSPSTKTPLRLEHAVTRDVAEVFPSRITTINNGLLIREMLQAGPAFAVFPDFTMRDMLLSGQLRNPLPDYSTPAVPVYALFTERRTALTNARTFADLLSERLHPRRDRG